MALNANDVEFTGGNKNTQEPLEIGTYKGRVVQIIDLGVQAQRPYKGEPKSPVQEIKVTYELLDEFMIDEDGNEVLDKPRWISEDMPLYNLKSERAKSTKRYLALDPKISFGGNWPDLLGATCMVNIVQNQGKGKNADKVYANVAGVAPMRARDVSSAAELQNPSVYFDLDTCDMDVWKKIPDWIQDKITSNLNFSGSRLEDLLGKGLGKRQSSEEEADTPAPAPAPDDMDFDDDIPF